jgi:hypothetical protein
LTWLVEHGFIFLLSALARAMLTIHIWAFWAFKLSGTLLGTGIQLDWIEHAQRLGRRSLILRIGIHSVLRIIDMLTIIVMDFMLSVCKR